MYAQKGYSINALEKYFKRVSLSGFDSQSSPAISKCEAQQGLEADFWESFWNMRTFHLCKALRTELLDFFQSSVLPYLSDRLSKKKN